MALPKHKLSKASGRRRRAQQKLHIPSVSACPECGEAKLSHHICKSCGKYNKETVITLKAKGEKG